MMLAEEITPLSSASKLAASAEWADPRSSACRISSLASRGYPSRSATVLVWAGSDDATESSITDSQRSVVIGKPRFIENVSRSALRDVHSTIRSDDAHQRSTRSELGRDASVERATHSYRE